MERFPLAWPAGWGRTLKGHRELGRFRSGGHFITVSAGVKRILEQLRLFGVQGGDAIISTNIKVRLDGLPYSGEKEPDDPGVAVYWKLPGDKTHKVMAIDIYTEVADNLGAIAATLDAMRAIERHGGAQILERAFTGFDALPGPEDFNWRTVLGLNETATLESAKEAYRRLSFERHPDHGGSDLMMAELNRAWKEAKEELDK